MIGNENLSIEFDEKKQSELLSFEAVLPGREIQPTDFLYLLVYSDGELINTHWLEIASTERVNVEGQALEIDFYELLVEDLDYNEGSYTIEYCVKREAIPPNNFAIVKEISKSKKEIRIDAPDEEGLLSIRPALIDQEYYAPIDVFCEGDFYKIVSWVFDEYYEDQTLILKFADVVPRKIKVGKEIELWDSLTSTRFFDLIIDIDLPKGLEEYTELNGPNVTVEYDIKIAKPTQYQSYDSILTGSSDINQRVINTTLSSSGAELNIDYRRFQNFIHFSSARERLVNFQYKLSLIEFYASKSVGHSSALSGQASSSVTGSNLYVSLSADFDLQKNKVIGTFDNYEKFLYYESASGETADGITYYPSTFPKSNSKKEYVNYSISSSQGQAWLTGSLASASRYDEDNLNLLNKTIPAAVRLDPSNSNFVLFVDMVSQHFDILYNYIDRLGEQRVRNEDLNTGISKDLIFDTLKSFGWKPQSGLDLETIWEYFIGSDADGLYQTTSSADHPTAAETIFVQSESLSRRDLELEPLSRVINNLPYILKTKGTKNSVRALLNCYGIPQSFFKIQEFGGPDPKRSESNYTASLRPIDVQNQALEFQGGLHDSLSTKVSFVSGTFADGTANDFQSVSLRFKTSYQNSQSLLITAQNPLPFATGRQNLFLIPSRSVGDPDTKYAFLKYSFADTNQTTYVSASLGKLPLLDNDWWNVFLTKNDTTKQVTLTCQKAPDHANGKITHVSSSVLDYVSTAAGRPFGWDAEQNDIFYLGHARTMGTTVFTDAALGGGQAKLDCFSGSMQEFRIWTEELNKDARDAHTIAPTSIVGNNYSSSYDNLVFRLPMGTDNNFSYNTASNNTFTSAHPDQSKTRGVSTQIVHLSGSFQWEDQEEVYYVSAPNSFGLRAIGDKIRIENNTIDGVLDPFEKIEISSADTNPIDLPDLYVVSSPQDDLDIDIAKQFGNIDLDEYIGDPRDRYKTDYQRLITLRKDYFKKYSGPQSIQAYVRVMKFINTALYDQIEQLLPARGTNVIGMMIKPTMLERSKVAFEPSFSLEENHYLGKTNRDLQNLEHYTQSIQTFNNSYLSSSDDYDAMVFTREDGSTSQFSILTDTVKTEAGNEPNRYTFNQTTIQNGVFNDVTFTEAGVMPYYHDQRSSSKYFKTIFQYSSSLSASLGKSYSSSFSPTTFVPQDDFLGLANSFYKGCRMTSDDFNIDSPDTIDGKPVVEFIVGNPNTLIADQPSFKGDLDVR